MSGCANQLETAIRATSFHSPTTFSWFGKRSSPLPPATRRAMTPKTARGYLLFSLQSQLYNHFYCRGFAAPAERIVTGCSALSVTPFVEALSAANCGSGSWEDGWEVCAIQEDGLVVRRAGLELRASPRACLAPRGVSIAPGGRVMLRFPKELRSMSPGFYVALGDTGLVRDGSQPLVRFYWHLTSAGAIHFMHRATRLLNQAGLPFQLKVLKDPGLYTRCDAGVVYVRKCDCDAAVAILERVYPTVVANLERRVPVFTRPLAPGVGLAEDPGQAESFGLHRCRLVADGMIRAYERGEMTVDRRLRVVAERFAEEGISLEKPFLNPGSSDEYHFQPRPARRSRRAGAAQARAPGAEAFLRVAADIGHRLAREAIWHGDRCNWVGGVPGPNMPTACRFVTTYRPLGPEVYAGTGGIALFLAGLHAATGNGAARRTALGALRQALGHADAVPAANRLGLYTGWTGIAFAATRVGTLLGEESLLKQAARLLQRVATIDQGARAFDLLSGGAGAIVALVRLREALDTPFLLECAVRLGDDLLRAADRSAAGCSWKSASQPGRRNLTGFSHGAAGIGYALLELFQATGDPRYLDAASQSFQYERSWFDPAAGNWPDFREEPARSARGTTPRSFGSHWCHGAPGVAVSRLRAYELLKDETCRAEALTALQTTRAAIEAALHAGTANFSLCHGLAGNAEVLLYGREVLGRTAGDAGLAHEVANAGVERYAALRRAAWPCGVAGQPPGLMLGLAGIGAFYLRLHSPVIPSILNPAAPSRQAYMLVSQ